MNILIATLRAGVRKALDDITPGVVDTFTNDADAEIDQALLHAAISLSKQLALDMVSPTVVSSGLTSGTRESDGSAYIQLPPDFLRFVSFTTANWVSVVSELIERGSDAEKHQRTPWSRGTASKPKAMLDSIVNGNPATSKDVLRYWPGTDTDAPTLVYVKTAKIETNTLECALKDECEKNVIYMACRIFLEGKKEHVSAEKFAQLTTI